MTPDLSIVLPSYRSAALARHSVEELARFLDDSGVGTWEILVVDDGGGDFPDDAWAKDSRVRLLRMERNQGKGAAVRHGMLEATGRARIFTDVDLPYGVELIPLIADLLVRVGFHMVIGDRTLPGSRYAQEQSPSRRLASRLASFFVGRLVTGGFFDTQCGLKGVRGDVAELIFPLLHVRRFAFDAELIYIALKHRLDIKRIPVELARNETSSVRIMRDVAVGALDLLRIKEHQLRGHYSSQALCQLTRDEFLQARQTFTMSSMTSAR